MRFSQLQSVSIIHMFILSLLHSLVSAQEPVAVLTPLHYVAYLGEPAVRFHCSAANASDVSWRINGRPIGNNIADLNARGISVETDGSLLETNVSISSTVSNNNTHILCVAHHLVEFRYVPTDEAVFQVQGTLGKCGLQITSLGTYHQSLTWNPPPTLNITAVEPDISGYVVCNNIRTQCTHIDMRESGGDSHNLLQYVFPNLRARINFTVTAVNVVGDGKSTNMVYEACEHPDGEPAPERFDARDLSAVVSFDSEGTPTLSLTMRSQRRCFDLYVVRLESVELETGSGRSGFHKLIETDPIIPSVDVSGDGEGRLSLNVTTNSTLSTNMFYNATLITILDMMEAGSVQLSTYDVQDARIRGGAENISIQCVFGSGSQARGCHVKIRNTTIQINITRNGSHEEETVTGLTPGSFDVLIFDWEEDGSITTTPSHQGHHIHVTGQADTSTPSSVPTTAVNIGHFEPTQLSTVSSTAHETATYVGVGSAAAILLLVAILIVVLVVIASTAVVKSHRKKANHEEPYYSTVNSEQPYYSTVSAQQPDAIEMKDNDAYVKPPPSRQEIIVEENPAYTVTA